MTTDKDELLSILPETGYVRIKHVLRVIPIGASTWWAGVKSGRYPAPVKIGARITLWRVEDIRALIEGLNNSRGEV